MSKRIAVLLSGLLIVVSLAFAGYLALKQREIKMKGTGSGTTALPPDTSRGASMSSSAGSASGGGFGEIAKPEKGIFSDTFDTLPDPKIWKTIPETAGSGTILTNDGFVAAISRKSSAPGAAAFSGIQLLRGFSGDVTVTAVVRDMSVRAGGTGSALVQFCDSTCRQGFFVRLIREDAAYFVTLSAVTDGRQTRESEKKPLPGGENVIVKLVRTGTIVSVYVGGKLPPDAFLTFDNAYAGQGFVRLGSGIGDSSTPAFVSRFDSVSVEGFGL
jgi:hypothetical protein